MKSRKELKAEYKRTPKYMGVYRIRNRINGKSYISSSTDITARFNRHRMELKTKKDPARTLVADWFEYGEDAFAFEILDLLEPLDTPGYNPGEDLKVLKLLWIEKLQPFEPNGYHPGKQVE